MENSEENICMLLLELKGFKNRGTICMGRTDTVTYFLSRMAVGRESLLIQMQQGTCGLSKAVLLCCNVGSQAKNASQGAKQVTVRQIET